MWSEREGARDGDLSFKTRRRKERERLLGEKAQKNVSSQELKINIAGMV